MPNYPVNDQSYYFVAAVIVDHDITDYLVYANCYDTDGFVGKWVYKAHFDSISEAIRFMDRTDFDDPDDWSKV